MKPEELIKNNALQNIEVAGKQKVVFEEIALTAVNMARKEEQERACSALEYTLKGWGYFEEVKYVLKEFKDKLEEKK